jgi:YYY domain-containing protein
MLPVISWWLALQIFGILALPLTWRLFARLPGRGYPFAKVLGLLLVSYALWLGSSFQLLSNTLGGVVVALLLLAVLSGWAGNQGLRRGEDGSRPLFTCLRANRGLVLATELLFLLVFVGWSVFRAYNPDIAGTEKPMEFAFINGVLSSPLLPPQDPWLSGYGISYYYFGYVMLAALIRMTGVLPEIGFNLGVAMWYTLVMTSAFGVVFTLVALARGVRKPVEPSEADSFTRDPFVNGSRRGPIGWGLLGALMLGFMANLEGLIDTGYQRGLLPSSFINWIDIKSLTESPPTGNWTGGFWWWWRASRVIHDLTLPVNGQRNSVEVIDEFPLFSFLLGDMHPHVLALPFVLLGILLCLNLLVGALSAPRLEKEATSFTGRLGEWAGSLAHATGLSWSGIILYAVALGSLAFLNTWDFPIYVGLAALAFGAGLALARGLGWRSIGGAVFAFLVVAFFGYILYTPFYIGFQSQLGGILPNLLFPSRFSQFFIMFGPFLVIAVAFLILMGLEFGAKKITRNTLLALAWTLLLPLILVAVVVVGFLVLPSGQAQVTNILQQPEIAANVPDQSIGGLLRLVAGVRLNSPWTYLVLAVLLAWAIGVVVTVLSARRTPELASPEAAGEPLEVQDTREARTQSVAVDMFATLMIVIALALTLFPEFLYLRDLFGSRMNTVFKFYYQAWALLALAAAYGLSRLAAKTTPLSLKAPALLLSGLLILGGLWYPLTAIPSKADNFQGQATLNGLAYLQRGNPADMAAIGWLRENVRRDAVVLEATGGSYSEADRVSMSTGNPTLLGWDFHERQWRGNAGYDKLAAMRPAVIDQIYRSARPEELSGLLNEWGVDYVYIGSLERSKYGVSDAAMARFDASLKKVYDADGVRIYAR